MIHNYFWVIHITVEKIIISQHMASRGGPLKVLTSGIYRGPSGESQGTNTKIDDFMKKLFFRSNSNNRNNKYSKVLKKDGRPRDVYGTQLQDVLGTSAGRWSTMFFN